MRRRRKQRQRLTASLTAVERHEDRLRHRIEEGARGAARVVVHSRAASRTPTLLLSFPGATRRDAYRFLADRGVNAPAGTFYALEASRRLGFG
jgi:selenocysteine lyase/cysteine desulfurase